MNGDQAASSARRAFLRRMLAIASATLPGGGRAIAAPSSAASELGVLVDLTRCIGCRACENACRLRQGRSGLPLAPVGYAPGEGRLSFTNLTFVDERVVANGGREVMRAPVKRQCMHCVEPACVSACPVAALRRTSRGAVVYDAGRCLGCRYCMIACPFSVPRYEWDSGLTPKVGKCDFCDDRLAAGRAPACVAACPTGALKSGRRDAVLLEARARLGSRPDRYRSIYGEDTVGGTAWIYISDMPMEQLGFRTNLPATPLAALTWRAISKVPLVVIGVGLFLGSVMRLWRKEASFE